MTKPTFYVTIKVNSKGAFTVNVIYCGKPVFPIYRCAIHSHKYWEIILHTSGSVISTVDGKDYNINTGDIMIIPPDILHGGSSNELYTDMFIQCEDVDFPGIMLLHDGDANILTLMNMLHKVCIEKEASYRSVANSLLHTICAYIDKFSEHKYKYDFVNTLKNEMYENMSNSDFKIADCIKKLGYNSDYVRRCFKEDLAVTPLEYLTTIRLNSAKRLLLQETYKGLQDVAEQCGFKDSFYLSKIFKQYFGLSPQAYRKSKV